jgi:hypothetical protein
MGLIEAPIICRDVIPKKKIPYLNSKKISIENDPFQRSADPVPLLISFQKPKIPAQEEGGEWQHTHICHSL